MTPGWCREVWFRMAGADRPPTWRHLIAQLTQNEERRRHLLAVLGINQLTLTRGIAGESKPRLRSLERLLEAFPQERMLLVELLHEEFPDLNLGQQADDSAAPPEDLLPSAFYAQVLDTSSTVPEGQRFWTISNLVLQQALGHLDPHHIGLALTVVQCLPSAGTGEVHSLLERIGRGTPPWPAQLEQYAILLGAESLVGYVVETVQAVVIQSRAEPTRFPAHWTQWEQSAAAYPLLRSGKMAGGLLVSCAQEHFFMPWRHHVLEQYALLLALAFEPDEFLPRQSLRLHLMPSYEQQQPHLAQMRERIVRVQIQARQQGRTLSYREAEQLAWQQVEADLLQM